MVDQQTSKKSSFSPFYLAILSGILLVILIINGLLEMKRARDGFYLLLEREGTVLLQHYEKNIQDILSTLQLIENPPSESPPPLFGPLEGLEESVAEYLVDLANRIDQMEGEHPLSPGDLQTLASRFLLTSIEFYTPAGSLQKGWPLASIPIPKPFLRELIQQERSVYIDILGKPLGREDSRFSIAVRRKTTPGILSLQLGNNQMLRLFRQFAIQRAISDLGLREGILYVSVQDLQGGLLAHTGMSLKRQSGEDLFIRNTLQHGGPRSRLLDLSQTEEVFEVAKALSYDHHPIGLIRIGYSPKEIDLILHQVRKTVALSIVFFLIFGISAIALISVNQNRHLRKMKELEDRIRLADRLSSLGHLAAGVAHEIRNPLNAIGMGIQRLKREFPPQEPSKQEEFLSFTDLIFREIRRVNQIIEQFLTLSRPFQLQIKESHLSDLLKNVITLIREEASSLRIQVEERISPSLPPLFVDEQKLTQALINIMKNGMQAMGKGGVLRIEAHPLKDAVEIKIRDTGTGIPVDQMDKIFNYYYTTKENGVGLGLPITHRILEAHGGRLTVESHVGKGTLVTLTLPIQKGGKPPEKG